MSLIKRVVVAVDPAYSKNDETGIIAVGLGEDKFPYILADYTGHFEPEEGIDRSVRLYCETRADLLAIERTPYRAGLVEHFVRSRKLSISIRPMRSRRKAERCLQIADMFLRESLREFGTFEALHRQLSDYMEDDRANTSRVDALDIALSALFDLSPSRRVRTL